MASVDPGSWIGHAEDDFTALTVLMDSGVSVPSSISFDAHQTAEKYLKAVIVASGVNPKYTHQLAELAKATCFDKSSVATLAPTIARLDSVYIQSRYPLSLPAGIHVEQLVADASEVREFCRNLLQPYL